MNIARRNIHGVTQYEKGRSLDPANYPDINALMPRRFTNGYGDAVQHVTGSSFELGGFRREDKS
jgi:hypothetical protein